MGQSGGGRFGWSVVGLLALAVFINYVDRGNIATAAPLIKDALHLSASQVGVLIAAFFWTYTPCQLLAGWLIERIDAYRTLALGLGIWSLATALTGLAGGFTALIALRLALGLGESAAFPASSTLLARHLPQERLGMANGMIGLGLSLGPAFGTFAGGLLMAQVGWRNVFLVFGLVSMLWLVPWLVRTRHLSRAAAAAPPGRGPSYLSLLRRRDAWGTYLGHFSANWATYFVLSWMPLYLVKARGYSVSAMAEIGGLIYVAYAVSNALAGWLTDVRIRGGASANSVRKTAAAACHLTIAVGLMIGAVADPRVSVAGLFLAADRHGLQRRGDLRHRPDPRRPLGDPQVDRSPEPRRQRRRHGGPGDHRLARRPDRRFHLGLRPLRRHRPGRRRRLGGADPQGRAPRLVDRARRARASPTAGGGGRRIRCPCPSTVVSI